MSLEPLIPNRLDDENSALVILDQTLLPSQGVSMSSGMNFLSEATDGQP